MNLLNKFIDRENFDNYEDFSKNFKIKIPDNFNFGYDVVDEYAKCAPDKKAVVWCNDKGEEKIITFGMLKELTDKTCNIFKKYDLKRGDFIMTMLNRRYEYWIIAVAAHKYGAVIIPATFLLTAKDIAYRTDNAKVKMLFCSNEDDIIKHVNEAKSICKTVEKYFTTTQREGYINFHEELEKASSNYIPKGKSKNDDPMLVYFTSGTTGYPKMVAHKYTYPIGFIVNAKFWQCVEDDGLHFTMAETGWAKCSWGKIYGQWIAGSAIFAYDYFGRFTPTDVLPLIEKYNITTFCAPPTIYRFLIKEDLSNYSFKSIKHCSTAGEPLNAEVSKEFKKFTGLDIYEGFGQSESTVLLGTYSFVEIHQGSMGKPSPIYDLFICDDNENSVSPGVVGEIVVRLRENQLGLFYAYYNDPERTYNTFKTGIYHTGDLAYRDAENYYWFVGRKDDIIKSSGYRIGPFEVESALHEHPAVLECAITAVPDAIRGQIVKATIVLAKGYSPSEELVKELQNHVKKATAPYKYPRIVEFVKELPKTISGKIKRVDIRKKDEK